MNDFIDEMIEALRDPEVSKEDILNYLYHENYRKEVCEEDGDDYEPSSFFYSKFYHGSRIDEETNFIDIDDMDEEDFISDELPTHTLGNILRFREAYA